MQQRPGPQGLRDLLSPQRGPAEPPPQPLWRAHLVLVRTLGAALVAPRLASRVTAADPFVLVRTIGDDRAEVDVWVEAADAGAAVRRALAAWSDLAELAQQAEHPAPTGVAPTGWDVVGLDLTRVEAVHASPPPAPAAG